MSIRQGQKLIASSTTNGFGLFDCKWADHILNNISWLRADTFSWQSGDVYVAAYEHLADDAAGVEVLYAFRGSGNPTIGDNIAVDTVYAKTETVSVGSTVYLDTNMSVSSTITGVSGNTITSIASVSGYDFAFTDGYVRNSAYDYMSGSKTDTIGNITITYYQAQDGHKICLPDQESNLSSLYENTGVAWYYILDTENKQFKLPRTKFGFTGIRSGVGGYVEPGLPNIEGSFRQRRDNSANTVSVSGAFSYSNVGDSNSFYYGNNNTSNGQNISFNASRSNNIYGNSDTVQPQATEMYLYFYVGNYVENATTIDVGKLTEIVNDFDIDTFKPEVDEAKSSAIVDISDAKTDAIDSLTNLAADLGTSLKYGNVGDIFYTSRLDVSLNGAVECNGNLYNTTDFSGAQSIGNLLRDSKVPYISLAEHQTTVDTYGSCRCFGWDGGTEFRVPKLADVFIEAGVAATEGEFITAGLPDHTHNTPYGKNDSGDHHAQGTSRPHISTNEYYATIRGYSKPSTLASASNAIYGNSTTVQPPAVRYRAMVQLAFGATDDAVVTAGNVVADVSELNSHRVIAFQAPTAENSYKWYRKYADGWIEQGVINVEIATAIYTFNFPVLMANTNYAVITSISDQLNTTSMAAKYSSKATTGVNVRCTYQASSIRGDIMVCGMAA